MFNETKWYAETATYRAVTGVSASFPQPNGKITVATFPTKGTVPIAKTPAGTINSDGVNVVGTGTAFGSSVKKGDFLYNGTVIRKIQDVIDDTHLVLSQEFPSDLSGETLKVCECQFFKAIYAHSSDPDADATALQEAPFRSGGTFLNGGAPIAYDATAGEISFTVHK